MTTTNITERSITVAGKPMVVPDQRKELPVAVMLDQPIRAVPVAS